MKTSFKIIKIEEKLKLEIHKKCQDLIKYLMHAKTIVHPESLLLLLDLEELCGGHHIGHIYEQ